ncbi:hypothetical protein [Demequina sp.]|uniref:hypothetical protein n=1 Tax=Demequina sp. TaxID=2050685 RepID=UPI003D098391
MLALAGCTAAQVTESAEPTVASGRLTVPDAVVTFPRTLQAARLVEAQVVTSREADALVTSARLESPLFVDSPARDGEVRLFPEWKNRVRVPLGTAVCPAPQGESVVVLRLVVDGRAVTEDLEFDDSVLRAINAEECAQAAVLDVATPSFGPVTRQDAASLDTTIVLTRGGSEEAAPVSLTSMTGNIVYIVTLDQDADRILAGGEASLAVPAVISVGRCDPHVFAESKKTFVFPVRLSVSDRDPSYVEIQPDEVTRSALQQLFDDCGEAERGD